MNWDEYFLNIACSTSLKSKCMSRKIGAVLVADKKFIIGTGYNDTPIGVPSCFDSSIWLKRFEGYPMPEILMPPIDTCPRRLLGYKSGEGQYICPAAHAERNAIDIAARRGISTMCCTLYLTAPAPCLECAKSIIQAGIDTVVVPYIQAYESKPITGLQLLYEAGIIIREYNCDIKQIMSKYYETSVPV